MRAVVLGSAGEPGLTDIGEPEGAGEVVWVLACGPCGSDGREARVAPRARARPARRHDARLRRLRGRRESRSTRTRIHYEEVTLRGAFHHTPRHVRAALAFLGSGAYPFERLVTHQVGLEGVAALLTDPPRDYLKAAVLP